MTGTGSRFHAEWVDPRGEVVHADLDAPDRDALVAALEPAQRQTLRRVAPAAPPGAGPGDVAWAARLLAGLLARGVPLGPALRDLAAVAGTGALARELERAARATDEGAPLTDVLARGSPLGPALSTPLVRDMLQAGERASRLPDLLLEAARLTDRLAATRQRARRALLYPLLLVSGSIVAFGLMATANGGGMADLLEGGTFDVRSGRGVLLALAAAGSRLDALWASIAIVLLLVFAAWRAAAGGIAPLRLRAVRDAATLQSLAALVMTDVAPTEAGTLLGQAAPGLLPAGAARPLLEGAPLAEALAKGGVVDGAERHALESGARAGARELAATLRELADARLAAFEDRARRLSLRAAVALEVAVGLALLCLGLPFLGSVWR
jgi:general secretion pathway protein F